MKRLVLILAACVMLTGCAADTTFRSGLWTFQNKSQSPPPCQPKQSPETNSGSMLSDGS